MHPYIIVIANVYILIVKHDHFIVYTQIFTLNLVRNGCNLSANYYFLATIVFMSYDVVEFHDLWFVL